jgi:hypothetical protein
MVGKRPSRRVGFQDNEMEGRCDEEDAGSIRVHASQKACANELTLQQFIQQIAVCGYERVTKQAEQ